MTKEEQRSVAKAQRGITIAYTIFWLCITIAFGYTCVSTTRQLDDDVLAASSVAQEELIFRRTVSPVIFGFKFQLVRDGQPEFTIGELKRIEIQQAKSFKAWKKTQNKYRQLLDETTREVVGKLDVVAVPPPLVGTLSDDEATTLRTVGIGSWAQ